jgi:hypothetical protein
VNVPGTAKRALKCTGCSPAAAMAACVRRTMAASAPAAVGQGTHALLQNHDQDDMQCCQSTQRTLRAAALACACSEFRTNISICASRPCCLLLRQIAYVRGSSNRCMTTCSNQLPLSIHHSCYPHIHIYTQSRTWEGQCVPSPSLTHTPCHLGRAVCTCPAWHQRRGPQHPWGAAPAGVLAVLPCLPCAPQHAACAAPTRH